MGTQLNVKRAETVVLAHVLARELGKSVTDTIHEALVEKRARREEEAHRRAVAFEGLLKDVRKLWKPGTENMTTKQIMDSIYDDAESDGFAR